MHVEVIEASISFNGTTVFDCFSASFRSGAVTALVGPSGSGKSSLLAAIAGYQPLAAGVIELRESKHSTPNAPDPGGVAWVPQGSNALGRRTVLDNVLIAALAAGQPPSVARSTAERALEQVGLADRLQHQARKLSGGELQRVALARALASGRRLILADEPSANLDATNTERVAELLTNLRGWATIIVATHDPVLVDAAQDAIHLRKEAAHHA